MTAAGAGTRYAVSRRAFTLASHRLVFAGVLLSAGALMKPLAAPFVPLLGIYHQAWRLCAGDTEK